MRLTDDQLHQLHRLSLANNAIADATVRYNSIVSELAAAGLSLRALPEFFLQVSALDITAAIRAHELAADAEKLERLAA